LLQNGAKRIFAIDVGRGVLHWRVRQDPRVEVMEGINARKLKSLSELVDLVTIDVSFISLRLLLPVIVEWLLPAGEIIALIKPQFEAGKGEVDRGGVIRDPAIHRRVIIDVVDCVRSLQLAPQGLHRSPIQGPKGNTEFFIWCKEMGTAVETQMLLSKVDL
jgi:23S rRNA (cytidine1920-2'-O)/16S rRNA (cytidine1409-2'-O)-methyltransferase